LEYSSHGSVEKTIKGLAIPNVITGQKFLIEENGVLLFESTYQLSI
jgi:hypothetical protein